MLLLLDYSLIYAHVTGYAYALLYVRHAIMRVSVPWSTLKLCRREIIWRVTKGRIPGGHPTRGANQSRRGARSRARAVHRSRELPAGYAVVPAGRRSIAGAHDGPSWNATRGARIICNDTGEGGGRLIFFFQYTNEPCSIYKKIKKKLKRELFINYAYHPMIA